MYYHECDICKSHYRTRPFRGGYVCEECVKYVVGLKKE